VNLLEKQLSTVYFKDVRFPVGHPIQLYIVRATYINFGYTELYLL